MRDEFWKLSNTLILPLLAGLSACSIPTGLEGQPDADSDASTEKTVPVETWQLDNGARVLHVHRPELPMVSMSVIFRAGSSRDPADKPGVSALAARLLDQGAGGLSADEMARRLDERGLRFGAGNGRDQLSVSITSLTGEGTTRAGWNLLTRTLTEPAFPEEGLQRERGRLLMAIRRSKERPGAVAGRAFYEAIYDEHPYARPTVGTPKGLKRVERTDLERFAERYFVGNNAVVAVVGALDRATVERRLEASIGQLPAGEAPAPLPEVAARQESREIFIEKDVEQSRILTGQLAIRRSDEDYLPLMMGNHTLGGSGLTSRLMEVIREEHGLAYSVSSSFSLMLRRGPFVAGLQTANENVGQALGLLREEVGRFLSEGPTEEELAFARRHITGSYPLRLDSNGDLRSRLATIGFHQLGADYLDGYRERVRTVEPAAVRLALREHLDAEAMVTVIVGPERPAGFGEAD